VRRHLYCRHAKYRCRSNLLIQILTCLQEPSLWRYQRRVHKDLSSRPSAGGTTSPYRQSRGKRSSCSVPVFVACFRPYDCLRTGPGSCASDLPSGGPNARRLGGASGRCSQGFSVYTTDPTGNIFQGFHSLAIGILRRWLRRYSNRCLYRQTARRQSAYIPMGRNNASWGGVTSPNPAGAPITVPLLNLNTELGARVTRMPYAFATPRGYDTFRI